ncbi:1,4-dihydroxy-2-naphthoate octaprenyltransferase [Sporobacter termitidis DSM 10068]|uniref:1,4-dihydroxy-2-naphthoate octaprenyltransferase n=1 Tax=Sporobacter termitidis DSM 10068 TaxID=1123282 RepID=A0A1M5Z163_9FIRM|nr:UbiA family prenyltransferase [Sporobacter termitidis]SHI17633.1 1,4-dihydroxy-2-naphthoate octaprenyltransferase [Sporobacter termitidis DSM 10068]
MKRRLFWRFWEYTQLPAKLACLLPFLLALFYADYTYHQISPVPTVIFFLTMLPFELTVTALNNYMDSKADGAALPFQRPAAKRILIVLWAVAAVGAVLLVWLEGAVVFVLGGLCVLVGIIYSFGPAPLSRMPLGEIFSGVFEGFFIPFLVVYINAPAQSLLWADFQAPVLRLGFNLLNLFELAVLAVPAILGIAAIMLANNICDVDNDVKVRRYTLPYYIGTKNAIRLYAALYGLAYAAVIAAALLKVLPPYVLLTLPGLFVVFRNVRRFKAFQSKKETFPLSIMNLLVMLVPLILAAAAAAVFS